MTNDFFVMQRRQRVRSRIVIATIFVLLWSVANAAVCFLHLRNTCSDGVCSAEWYPNVKVLLITALVVVAYLALAPLIAKRATVHAGNMRSADGPDGILLRNVVAEMAIAAGIPTPRAYIIDDRALNAYAFSNGRRQGVVACTSGLLDALDRQELTAVVAHETAHIRNRDSGVILVAVLATGALVALAAIAIALAESENEASLDDDDTDGGGAGAIALLAAIVLVVVAIPAAVLLRAALSRRREQLADASAVQLTRDPTGLRRALEKINSAGKPVQAVSAITQSLWIDNPNRLRPNGMLARLLDTHPPIEQRIAWLRSLEGPRGAVSTPDPPDTN